MTKQKYLSLKKLLAEERQLLNQKAVEWRQEYIEANKPCEIDQMIRLTSSGGNIYEGKAKDFSLFNDEVIVTRIEVNGKSKHISKPAKSIQLL
jgi:hypothetical protein